MLYPPLSLELRIQRVSQPVTHHIETEHRQHDGDAGEGDHRPEGRDEFPARVEDRPPLRRGGLDTQNDE